MEGKCELIRVISKQHSKATKEPEKDGWTWKEGSWKNESVSAFQIVPESKHEEGEQDEKRWYWQKAGRRVKKKKERGRGVATEAHFEAKRLLSSEKNLQKEILSFSE